MLELDGRGDVEDADEESAEGEGGDPRAAHRDQEGEDRQVEHVHQQDGVPQLRLGQPARQDRMRGVQGAVVLLDVDPALEVEVVVDHVVRRVRDHQADDRQRQVPVVDRHADGTDRKQPADETGGGGHAEDRGAGHDHPLAEPVHLDAGGQVGMVHQIAPGRESPPEGGHGAIVRLRRELRSGR